MAINYPVDVENTRWSLYKLDTSEVISTRNKWSREDGGEIVGLDPNITFLLEVQDGKPTYEPSTHKLEKTVTVDLPNNTITNGWSAVALTQAEIDERTPAHVEINGIKWKTDEVSQAAFSSMTLLIDKAGMAETDMVMIKDALGDTRAMTVSQYSADVLQYGMACYTQFHS